MAVRACSRSLTPQIQCLPQDFQYPYALHVIFYINIYFYDLEIIIMEALIEVCFKTHLCVDTMLMVGIHLNIYCMNCARNCTVREKRKK